MRKAVIHTTADLPSESALPAFDPHREKVRPANQCMRPGLQAARFAQPKMRTDPKKRLLGGLAGKAAQLAAEFAFDPDPFVIAGKISGKAVHLEWIIRYAGETCPGIADISLKLR